MTREHPSRVPALDALRGVAILLVITWHFLPEAPNGAGGAHDLAARLNALSWSGVDLFFVLSGYLICGILIDHRGASNYYSVFYGRRFCRIIPLYLIALLIAGLRYGDSVWDQLPIYLSFLQNFLMAATADFQPNGLGVTWSLAIEEQFYLGTPFLIRLTPMRRLPLVLAGCIVAAPLCRALAWTVFPPANAAYVGYLLLPCRMDALAMGALAAWAVRNDAWRRIVANPAMLRPCAVALALLMVVFIATGKTSTDQVFIVAAFSAVDAFWLVSVVDAFWLVVLLLCVYDESLRLWTRLVPFLAPVGIGAYSLYLFHFYPSLWVPEWSDALGGGHGGIWTIVKGVGTVAVFFALPIACWHLVERPFIRFGHRLRYDRGAAVAARPEPVVAV